MCINECNNDSIFEVALTGNISGGKNTLVTHNYRSIIHLAIKINQFQNHMNFFLMHQKFETFDIFLTQKLFNEDKDSYSSFTMISKIFVFFNFAIRRNICGYKKYSNKLRILEHALKVFFAAYLNNPMCSDTLLVRKIHCQEIVVCHD